MRILLLSKDLEENEKKPCVVKNIFIILVIIIGVTLLVMLLVDVVVLGQGLLVLLVLGHQVVEVGLGLRELHLVHALASVPVEEGLPPEHGSELLGDPLEQLLDGRGVTHEGSGHLQTPEHVRHKYKILQLNFQVGSSIRFLRVLKRKN